MTLPAILFGLVIALLTGALYHALRGGDGGRLLWFLAAGILGFLAGQALSVFLGWELFRFGWLDVGMGVVASIVLLIGADWLTRPRQ